MLHPDFFFNSNLELLEFFSDGVYRCLVFKRISKLLSNYRFLVFGVCFSQNSQIFFEICFPLNQIHNLQSSNKK